MAELWVTWESTTRAHRVTDRGRSPRTKCGNRIRPELTREASRTSPKCATCTGVNSPPGRGRPRRHLSLIEDEL